MDGSESASTVKPGTPAGKPTVLLADDEPMVLTISRLILENAGFTVLTADDGCQALAVFEANADTIACVILDFSMPRMNGEDAARRIRAMRPGVRILVATGSGGAELQERMRGIIDGYVQKPFHIDELGSRIRAAIAGV